MPIVSIEDDDKEYIVDENEILFDALSRQGCTLHHGCLAGSCGACRIEILEGSENLKAPSAIEQNTIEAIRQNYIRIHGAGSLDNRVVRLSCRARVQGNIKFKKLS